MNKAAKANQQIVSLRIIVERPPAGIDFALQKGKGNDYETFQKKRSSGKDLTFEFSADVKEKGSGIDFSGPFVQGAAGDRFVYIDIGRYAGQTDTECARRLKVPLSGISRSDIQEGRTMEARIPGTAPDGQPSCAYIWRKQMCAGWGWTFVSK